LTDLRIELQAEVDVPRAGLFPLVSTADGLARWLDAADLEPEVGRPVRLRLLRAEAVGEVLAVDPPQHISWSWDWEGEPLGVPSVVAFDLIDHGHRTHLTLRHVGFRTQSQCELHDALWAYWFGRLLAAARSLSS
jgi:uncharacterized protein YndB with AHSA1/START domain